MDKKYIWILGILVVTILSYISYLQFFKKPDMPVCYDVDYTLLQRKKIDKELYIVNENDEIVIKNNDYEVSVLSTDYLTFAFDGIHGLMNSHCEVIVEPEYDDFQIHGDPDFEAIIAVKQYKYYFLDENYNVNIDTYYESISIRTIQYINGYIESVGPDSYTNKNESIFMNLVVSLDDKVGMVNQYGEIVVPIEYDHISAFKCNPNSCLLTVAKDWKYGIIDENLDIVLPLEYKRIRFGFIQSMDEKFGLVNRQGEIIVAPTYSDLKEAFIGVIDDFYYIVSNEFGYGVINSSNDIVIPFEYTEIKNRGDLFVVKKDGSVGVVTHDNNLILPFEYDDVDPSEDFAIVTLNENVGIIDYDGNVILDLIYQNVSARMDYDSGELQVNVRTWENQFSEFIIEME